MQGARRPTGPAVLLCLVGGSRGTRPTLRLRYRNASSTAKRIEFGWIALNRISRGGAFSRYAARHRASRGAAIGGATCCRLCWRAADVALVIAAHVVERRQQIADVV